MTDKPRIIIGLLFVLVAVTFPFWYALAAGPPGAPPELELPKGEGECVHDAKYMRAHHMDVLEKWRQQVVREGDKSKIKIAGKEYDKSLTRTCMDCHTSRENFCAKCHEYADVQPTCWNCHNETKGD